MHVTRVQALQECCAGRGWCRQWDTSQGVDTPSLLGGTGRGSATQAWVWMVHVRCPGKEGLVQAAQAAGAGGTGKGQAGAGWASPVHRFAGAATLQSGMPGVGWYSGRDHMQPMRVLALGPMCALCAYSALLLLGKV